MTTESELNNPFNKVLNTHLNVGMKLNQPSYIEILLYNDDRTSCASINMDRIGKTLTLQVHHLEPYYNRGSRHLLLSAEQSKQVIDRLDTKFWPELH